MKITYNSIPKVEGEIEFYNEMCCLYGRSLPLKPTILKADNSACALVMDFKFSHLLAQDFGKKIFALKASTVLKYCNF